MSTSVLIIDSHEMIAELLRTTMDEQPDLTVVRCTTTVADGVALSDELQPDLVLMGVHERSDDVFEAVAEVTRQCPHVRVVILTEYAHADLLQRAAAANARGLHLMEAGLERLFWVLRHTEHNGLTVHPDVLHRWLSGVSLIPRQRRSLPVRLTRREMEVLRLLARGMDIRSISQEARMSPHTCRGHLKSIFAKLDSHTQLEAVAKAIGQGLLQGWPGAGDGERAG